MGRFANYGEVEEAVKEAATFEQIGDIFRAIFSPYGAAAFTKRSAELYEDAENALARLSSQENISQIEYYDVNGIINSLPSDAYEEIKAAHPEYKGLTSLVDTEKMKNEAIQAGSDLVKQKMGEIVVKAAALIDARAKLQEVLERTKSVDFLNAKKYLADMLTEELEKYFPHKGYMIPGLLSMTSYSKEYYSESQWPVVQKFLEIKEQFSQEVENKFQLFKEVRDAIRESELTVERNCKEIFESVSNSLFDASGITQEEADAWASRNVYIDKSVERKLKNIGYPKEQLIKDISEVYRFTGGKLGPIEMIATRKERAFARPDRMQIAISRYFDKRTLFHECGHITEGLDRTCIANSITFRDSRATGKLQTLKKITGNPGYSASEVAYPDNFINPYVGKVYQGMASEVYSMALEQMSSPDKIANFINKDIEHFNLFIGCCLHKNPELKRKIDRLCESASTQNESNQAKQQSREAWLDAIKKAMPADFFLDVLTQREGYDNYRIEGKTYKTNSASGNGWLYCKNEQDDGSWDFVTSGKIYDLLKCAYLALANDAGLIDFKILGSRKYIARTIGDEYVLGEKIPDWFDKDKGLPKLQLSPDATGIAKKKSGKVFLAAVKAAIPNNLFEALQTDVGVTGFTIADYATPKSKVITLYHKETDNQFYLKARQLLPMAYLLIMNQRKLLPKDYGSVYSAERNFIDYVTGRYVPGWFDPDVGLPELQI